MIRHGLDKVKKSGRRIFFRNVNFWFRRKFFSGTRVATLPAWPEKITIINRCGTRLKLPRQICGSRPFNCQACTFRRGSEKFLCCAGGYR
jgi:hypothetical protein